MTVTEQLSTLGQILAHGDITTLFQPIVSLSERRILGYEALSRGPSNSPLHSPINLLTTARHAGRLNELEMTCRETACRRYSQGALRGKLFLNASPETLLDATHKPGRTLELLQAYGISADEVVIELTEQAPADDLELLDKALHHYRSMGFSIALDDLGAGYSSLRLWSELRPDYVKIDRYFIDGIHLDPVKREFVESILKIARASRAQVIAEGIELQEELVVLASMGIDLVQGYLLGRPMELPPQNIDEVLPQSEVQTAFGEETGNLSALLIQQPAMSADRPVAEMLEAFRLQPNLNSIAVLDTDARPVGVIHRNLISEALLKPYATDLLARKPLSRLMSTDFLAVELDQSLQQVSRLLTSRARQRIEEDFVITQAGRYHGLGRVIDVLRLITELKIQQARHANPLTLLPGNVPIQQCLNERVDPRVDFVGHIGGDDFMLVLGGQDGLQRIDQLQHEFLRRSRTFYQREHLESGGFVSANRDGRELLSLSIGIVDVRPEHTDRLDAGRLAALASEAKRQAKQTFGPSVHVLDADSTSKDAHNPSCAAFSL
ncbi:GGDEF domain-containing protein [Stutzerimonas stutzeri]|uniref:GGDEF domain-containing protein n=1 Tax=Stutzerimonas stutzeri TaxID=316 RepID=A0ABD4XXD0_STUST|nr:GGDEF domain-containing protein [Stutzerimonas stutzeri]MDH0082648.1 GGDEF domain-containing protein [Stutzerimonas stutzeri]MDH0687518.1 GGDEF domain-containing protein [Stutzerimonas stutzeri]